MCGSTKDVLIIATHVEAGAMNRKVMGPHEDLTYRIIGVAMAVHRNIGPGQKVAIYQRALEVAFAQAVVVFEAQKKINRSNIDIHPCIRLQINRCYMDLTSC